jgi:hypothetical protein
MAHPQMTEYERGRRDARRELGESLLKEEATRSAGLRILVEDESAKLLVEYPGNEWRKGL